MDSTTNGSGVYGVPVESDELQYYQLCAQSVISEEAQRRRWCESVFQTLQVTKSDILLFP